MSISIPRKVVSFVAMTDPDSRRWALQGICLSTNGQMATAIASDGRRMVHTQWECKERIPENVPATGSWPGKSTAEDGTEERYAIIPTEALDSIGREKKATLSVDIERVDGTKNRVTLHASKGYGPGVSCNCNLVEGRYPSPGPFQDSMDDKNLLNMEKYASVKVDIQFLMDSLKSHLASHNQAVADGQIEKDSCVPSVRLFVPIGKLKAGDTITALITTDGTHSDAIVKTMIMPLVDDLEDKPSNKKAKKAKATAK